MDTLHDPQGSIAPQNINPTLNKSLQSITEVVNFIKIQIFNCIYFRQMHTDMGDSQLFYYYNTYWLPYANIFLRVFILTNELLVFLIKTIPIMISL